MPGCLHNASMPNVMIRNLPEDVHGELTRRAEAQGKSLQQYLTAELKRLVMAPTVDDVLSRIARRRGGKVGLQRAVRDLARERADK